MLLLMSLHSEYQLGHIKRQSNTTSARWEPTFSYKYRLYDWIGLDCKEKAGGELFTCPLPYKKHMEVHT